MKRRTAVQAMVVFAIGALGLMTVFAIELSNIQSRSKADVISRVHQRDVLAGALIDSLFETVEQAVPKDARLYGTRAVSAKTMNREQQTNKYIALLSSSDQVLAHSRGFTPEARADLARSAALALVRAGRPYGLGNIMQLGKTGVIDLAIPFPTRFGTRILLTGFNPTALSVFLGGDLRKIPGVKGSANYIVDGNRRVLATTDPAHPDGSVLGPPGPATPASLAGDHGNHYSDEVAISNAEWRVIATSPDGPLFASVSGWHKLVPWLIFGMLALVTALAFVLAGRAVRSADRIHEINDLVEATNQKLEASNALLERRAAQLARSNAELDQFASIASHDLQEPLRKVRAFTAQAAVIDAEGLSEKGRDYLSRANAAAERMQTLIEDLLKFSRVATTTRPFAPVNLDAVTREVIGDLEAQVESTGAQVTVGELPTINADALQMRQLMQNLISNAIKFHRRDVTPEVSVTAQILGDKAKIVVRDNGIGFEEQYNQRIFRVFERLHGRSEYAGTGIGLALCGKIAERHGGTVVAVGEPGVGSTFTVTLPLNLQEEILVVPEVARDDATTISEEIHA